MSNDPIYDPAFLAYKFNFETEHVEFLPIDRRAIRQAASLNRESLGGTQQTIAVPLAEFIGLLDNADSALRKQSLRFIYHTAFCASTFLSRALEIEGVSVSLREPQLLLDAANAKRLQWRSRTTKLDFRHLPKLALLLLQKHADGNETLIVKPMNCVNNIVTELQQISGAARSLMLYNDARNFILSMLKKGEGGKQTVRSMFDLLRCDFPHLAGLQLTHALQMTDLRVAMTLWRLHIEQAEALLQQFAPNNSMASLYGENLVTNPAVALRAAFRFLQLGASEEQIEAATRSDARSLDAKNPQESFSPQKRAQAYQALEKYFGGDIDDGLQWLVRNNPGTSLIPKLSETLPH